MGQKNIMVGAAHRVASSPTDATDLDLSLAAYVLRAQQATVPAISPVYKDCASSLERIARETTRRVDAAQVDSWGPSS